VSIEDFVKVLEGVKSLWQEKIEGFYKREGRPHKLGMEEMVMATLIYYRCYMTHEFLGCFFGIHQSQMTRIINKIRPLLADFIDLNVFKREITKDDAEKLIQESMLIDATEQHIERPGDNDKQKSHYSGKKKSHTVKTDHEVLRSEIRVRKDGKIRHVSKSVAGSMHDLKLHESEPALDPNTRAFVDSGYQGLQKTHTNIDMPYKKPKAKELRQEEKEYNTALSRLRVKVEHIFGDIKVFRIIKETYRNNLEYYNQIFKTIAGIVNIKNKFVKI